MAPHTEATKEEVDMLMSMLLDDEELRAIEEEFKLCFECTGAKVTTKGGVRRRAHLLHDKRHVGPGASGWRNSYICDLVGTLGGPQQLRAWTQHWTQSELPLEVSATWTGKRRPHKTAALERKTQVEERLGQLL